MRHKKRFGFYKHPKRFIFIFFYCRTVQTKYRAGLMFAVVIFGTASTAAFAAISAASAFFSFFANCNCRHKSKRKNCTNNNIPNIHNAPLLLHTYQGADRIDYKRRHPCNQALPSNNRRCPFGAELTLNGSNRSNTWSI